MGDVVILRLLAGAIGREIKGLGRLRYVLVLALFALLLPQISSAQQMVLTSFSSPPPGTPVVTVTLGGNAELTARVQVTDQVTVTCGPFLYTYGNATDTFTVSQVQNKKVVSYTGSTIETIVCDNAPHSYHAVVVVPNGGTPFRIGSTLLELTVTQCGVGQNNLYVCATGFKSRSVNLR